MEYVNGSTEWLDPCDRGDYIDQWQFADEEYKEKARKDCRKGIESIRAHLCKYLIIVKDSFNGCGSASLHINIDPEDLASELRRIDYKTENMGMTFEDGGKDER